MTSNPGADLVSVVVASYDHERYIERALASVVAQDHGPLELIVIDDCSSDETYQLVERFIGAHSDQFVRATGLRSPVNRGAAATFNQGMALASGQWISLLNSDDEYVPARLSTLLRALDQQGGSWAFSGVLPTGPDGEASFQEALAHRIWWGARLAATMMPSMSWGFLSFQQTGTSGNLMLSRALANDAGDFADLTYCHDWDLMLRLSYLSEPVFVSEDLYRYRLHETNTFRQVQAVAESETSYCLRGHFRRVMSSRPPNSQCPAPQNWPTLFGPLVESMGFRAHLDAIYQPYRTGHRTVHPGAHRPSPDAA